jgi:hypothetical protein
MVSAWRSIQRLWGQINQANNNQLLSQMNFTLAALSGYKYVTESGSSFPWLCSLRDRHQNIARSSPLMEVRMAT